MNIRILICLAIFTFLNTHIIRSQDIELELELDKTEFIVDEPIMIECSIVNKSTKNEVISTHITPKVTEGFRFVIEDESGNHLKYRGMELNVVPGKGYDISISETIIRTYELLEIFGESDEYHFSSYYLKPGNYNISAIYVKNYHKYLELHPKKRKSWIETIGFQKIKSNAIKFKVIPVPHNWKDFHRQYLNALKNDYAGKYMSMPEFYIDSFNNHPDNPFSLIILRSIYYYVLKNQDEELFNTFNKIVKSQLEINCNFIKSNQIIKFAYPCNINSGSNKKTNNKNEEKLNILKNTVMDIYIQNQEKRINKYISQRQKDCQSK